MLRFYTPIFTSNVTRISSRRSATAALVYVQQAAALSGRGNGPDASSDAHANSHADGPPSAGTAATNGSAAARANCNTSADALAAVVVAGDGALGLQLVWEIVKRLARLLPKGGWL